MFSMSSSVRFATAFFISWAPLSYDAKAGISIGVSYSCEILGIATTFRIELSASARNMAQSISESQLGKK